ncbi:uncharacterized protein N7515_010255 [Penicillium bovifimosum]|uniref:Uncharacterized protein n=1 Tax=Penicillium bovifimosum TaxID=126998 RepID=A0A9W9GJH6_9EURO|nr:uncharacterized protein N7515_010255 [Penicillium bovifimosum]KAJ5120867.1 hypothetical protein N7515_010255 [Penicillium bovifimosum]
MYPPRSAQVMTSEPTRSTGSCAPPSTRGSALPNEDTESAFINRHRTETGGASSLRKSSLAEMKVARWQGLGLAGIVQIILEDMLLDENHSRVSGSV